MKIWKKNNPNVVNEIRNNKYDIIKNMATIESLIIGNTSVEKVL